MQVLGTLGNLTALDLPKGVGWVDVMTNYNFATFLTKLLVPGMAQNDIVLEVLFAVAYDYSWASLIKRQTCAPHRHVLPQLLFELRETDSSQKKCVTKEC